MTQFFIIFFNLTCCTQQHAFDQLKSEISKKQPGTSQSEFGAPQKSNFILNQRSFNLQPEDVSKSGQQSDINIQEMTYEEEIDLSDMLNSLKNYNEEMQKFKEREEKLSRSSAKKSSPNENNNSSLSNYAKFPVTDQEEAVMYPNDPIIQYRNVGDISYVSRVASQQYNPQMQNKNIISEKHLINDKFQPMIDSSQKKIKSPMPSQGVQFAGNMSQIQRHRSSNLSNLEQYVMTEILKNESNNQQNRKKFDKISNRNEQERVHVKHSQSFSIKFQITTSSIKRKFTLPFEHKKSSTVGYKSSRDEFKHLPNEKGTLQSKFSSFKKIFPKTNEDDLGTEIDYDWVFYRCNESDQNKSKQQEHHSDSSFFSHIYEEIE
ncbi:hypothetical protein M153_1550004443 [Pseudoloma neurophilia]|uniref:Uncharacterized protein n=1 Tax=Pseudoloma neurophilia TaxID=146866 RepID=A0A0R0LZN5_9MICR|nr:hypothetical protein M153_1550004443 [Pseudoloma neurophilia]